MMAPGGMGTRACQRVGSCGLGVLLVVCVSGLGASSLVGGVFGVTRMMAAGRDWGPRKTRKVSGVVVLGVVRAVAGVAASMRMVQAFVSGSR